MDGGVTVHRADGDRLAVGVRCDQVGLDLGASPLVVRFRPNFAVAPALVREVTLLGVTQQGAAFAQAVHAGRVADCAALGQQACLGQILDPGTVSLLTRLEGAERLLAGRDLRGRRRGPRVTGARSCGASARRRCAGWRSWAWPRRPRPPACRFS